ncbi:hypothetical protein KAW80_03760 [Candidatus Babeliales bacterium]|nr:hypothetical protein [Candidatus Babeliales bacterium]
MNTKRFLLLLLIFKITFSIYLSPNTETPVEDLVYMHLALKSNLNGNNGFNKAMCLFTLGNFLRNQERVKVELNALSKKAYYINNLTTGQNKKEKSKTYQNLKVILQYLLIMLKVHNSKISYFFSGPSEIIQHLEGLIKLIPGNPLNNEEITTFIKIKNMRKNKLLTPNEVKEAANSNTLLKTFIEWLIPLQKNEEDLTCAKILYYVIPKYGST